MWTFSRVVAVVMLLSVMLEAIYCQSPDFTYQEFEREVHRLVNIEREKKGLKPLYFSKHLASCARKHSEDMLQNGYFSHIGKDGSSFVFLLTRCGDFFRLYLMYPSQQLQRQSKTRELPIYS